MKIAAISLLSVVLCLTTYAEARISADAAKRRRLEHRKLQYAPFEDDAIKGQYVIVMKSTPFSESGVLDMGTIVNEWYNSEFRGAEIVYQYETVFTGVVLKDVQDSILEVILDDVRVDFVEEDFWLHETDTSTTRTQSGAPWGLDRIDQTNLPLNNGYSFSADGSGVWAFILDSGIYRGHYEFEGRAICGMNAFTGEDGDLYPDCCNDDRGHGTHVAGTVGGKTYGVAKGVTLIGVKVLNSRGSGSISSITAGINYMVKKKIDNRYRNVPMVANVSISGGKTQAVDKAITNASNRGIFVAVSAGNSNTNACDTTPAGATGAIAVGSTDREDKKSSFSSWGRCVKIFAPGSKITSASIGGPYRTEEKSGTSMASPHVAGAAALYLQNNKSLSPSKVLGQMLQHASTGKISGLDWESPNKLLNVGYFSPRESEACKSDFLGPCSIDADCCDSKCSIIPIGRCFWF